MLIPAAEKLQMASDRAEQIQRNLQIAVALAACKSDTGRYPKKLDELAPRYLESVPQDIFSGKALMYFSKVDSYLLYSVGPNGRDDQTDATGQTGPSDDIVVPLEPLSGRQDEPPDQSPTASPTS